MVSFDSRTLGCEDRRVGEDPRHVSVATLRRLLDAFTAHDIEAVMSFFADDRILEMPRAQNRGDGGWKEGLRSERGSGAGLPEFRTSTTARIDTGCLASAAVEWLLTGTTMK